MLSKVDTATTKIYQYINHSIKWSGRYTIKGTQETYILWNYGTSFNPAMMETLSWKWKLNFTLNITDTGYGDTARFRLRKDNELVEEFLVITNSSWAWTATKTIEWNWNYIYYIKDNISESSTSRPVWNLKWTITEIKDLDYKKLKIYELKQIGKKATAILFGKLPTGERRDGN